MRFNLIPAFVFATALASPGLAQQQQQSNAAPVQASAGQSTDLKALQAARQQLRTAALHLRQVSQNGDEQAVEQARSNVQKAIDGVRQAMQQLSPEERAKVQESLRQAEEGLQVNDNAANVAALDRLVDVVAVIAIPVAPVTSQPATGQQPASLADWSYNKLYAQGWRADQLIDAAVYGPKGEQIGEVENVIIGPEGNILSVIAEIGGFWDIGDTHVNVPWSEVGRSAEREGITIPVNEETVEDYSLFPDSVLTGNQARAEVKPVNDDLTVGPRAWKLTSLLGDYVRLRDVAGYGYVDDVIFDKAGRLQAVVVQPDVRWGAPGPYAYPFHSWSFGWDPALDYYELPYTKGETMALDRFDYAQLKGRMDETDTN